jgi:hypothetical protein
MVQAMLELCVSHSLQAVTFPIRACYARRSWESGCLSRLLTAHDGHTLTVWSNAQDMQDRTEMEVREEELWLRSALPPARTFFDLV